MASRLLTDLRAALLAEPNVRFALLFGSAASGDDVPGSDVDLLVSLRDPRLEALVDLADDVAARVGRPADVVRLEDAGRDPGFLTAAVEHGIPLVDREERWPELQARAEALARAEPEREARRVRDALEGIDRLFGEPR